MASQEERKPLEGGCPCSRIRYRLDRAPLIVHCCHCTWCQRETGSAFVLNVMLETKFVTLLSAESPEIVFTPSKSGDGQRVARCPSCQHAVWSNYGHSSDIVRFVKAGTLDDPTRVPPDIHIFVKSKHPWIKLDDSVPIFNEFYDRKEVWSKSSLGRMDELYKSLSA